MEVIEDLFLNPFWLQISNTYDRVTKEYLVKIELVGLATFSAKNKVEHEARLTAMKDIFDELCKLSKLFATFKIGKR